MRINEPAADLAVAAALVSSLTGAPVLPDMVCFVEIGLSGEVRAVSQADNRLKEAAKLGFAQALTPTRRQAQKKSARRDNTMGLRPIELKDLGGLHDLFQETGDEPIRIVD